MCKIYYGAKWAPAIVVAKHASHRPLEDSESEECVLPTGIAHEEGLNDQI